MHKLLVVDDEPKHRRCLAEMIKVLRPEYKVLEAKNGKEALELIESESMDIIITDIRMPIMDGLSFMEFINMKARDTKVIILSGFAYFEYAQKALSLGAFDFVLKPVNEAKVSEILDKVEKEIEKESKEHQNRIELENQLNTAFPAYVDQKFNGWVNGYLNADGLEEIEKIFPFKGNGFVIATEIARLSDALKDYRSDEIYEIKLNVKQWIKETLHTVGHTISFFLESNRNIMITILNTNVKCDMGSKDNPYMLNEFIQNMKASYGLDAFIGIGNEYTDVFNNIRLSFDEALLALEYKFYENKSSVFSFSDYEGGPHFEISKECSLINKAKEAFSIADVQKATEFIRELFESANLNMPPQQFKDLIEDLVLWGIKQFQNITQEEQKTKLLSDARKWMLKAENLSELRQAVEDIITGLKALKSSKNDKIIKACEKYVSEHYMEDIPLDSVAEMFCFNSSYFSSYFKKKIGMNFSDYLQKVRMEKAVELLSGHALKVYEVAEKVGYQNVKYFNKVFKKEFGVSPDEYRRVHNN